MHEWAEILIVLPFLAAGIYVVIAQVTGYLNPKLVSLACYCVALSLFVAALEFQQFDPPSLTIFYILCSIGLAFWGARIQGRK